MSTATSSAELTLITGTNAPSAQVPYISEWVQGSTTATYTLVGQVLDNGETNFVGYDEGDALYLLTTSASGATPTTLGDGQDYFYTSGSAPSGYLATTEGGSSASQTSGGGDASMTTSRGSSSTNDGSATETGSVTVSETMSSSSTTSEESASAAETSQPGAGNRLSVFSVGIGMTLFTAVVFGVMG